jgi:O-methyltransferase involved in polyketide biosynthesis
MKKGRASKTAKIVAAVRAKHTLYDQPKVFDDPWAISLTSPAWRFICRARWISRLVFDGLYRTVRSTQATIVGRARFVEDALDRAIANHDTDYIILGAGFDSFGLRQLGLSYYLPRDTLFRLVEAIPRDFPAASELVVDIPIDPRFMSKAELPGFRKVERMVARRGEEMITRFHPGDFIEACRDVGMELVECVSPAQLTARYFADRTDGVAASPDMYLLHFRAI